MVDALPTPLRSFLSGALACTGAVLFTNPLDVAKIRFQLAGELNQVASRQYKNVFDALWSIGQKEGLRGLQSGLAPALVFQVALNGTRLGAYPALKSAALSLFGEERASVSSLVAGAATGALGAFVGTPANLIKCRLQAQSAHFQALQQHHYTGMGHALRSIVAESGVAGLWQGATAAMLRIAVGSAVQFMVYDGAKDIAISKFGLADGAPAHLGAALMAGAVVAVAMNPFDVVSTRVFNQAPGVLYTGIGQCLTSTVKAEGVLALWKGTTAQYVRIGPHTVLTFVFWEQTKQLFRVE